MMVLFAEGQLAELPETKDTDAEDGATEVIDIKCEALLEFLEMLGDKEVTWAEDGRDVELAEALDVEPYATRLLELVEDAVDVDETPVTAPARRTAP